MPTDRVPSGTSAIAVPAQVSVDRTGGRAPSAEPGNSPAAEAAPLLLDAAGVGRLLSISRASVFGLLAAGRLPAPCLRAGRIVRWDRRELEAWISGGCVAAGVWAAIRGDAEGFRRALRGRGTGHA